jgi:hypothetical protein
MEVAHIGLCGVSSFAGGSGHARLVAGLGAVCGELAGCARDCFHRITAVVSAGRSPYPWEETGPGSGKLAIRVAEALEEHAFLRVDPWYQPGDRNNSEHR